MRFHHSSTAKKIQNNITDNSISTTFSVLKRFMSGQSPITSLLTEQVMGIHFVCFIHFYRYCNSFLPVHPSHLLTMSLEVLNWTHLYLCISISVMFKVHALDRFSCTLRRKYRLVTKKIGMPLVIGMNIQRTSSETVLLPGGPKPWVKLSFWQIQCLQMTDHEQLHGRPLLL